MKKCLYLLYLFGACIMFNSCGNEQAVESESNNGFDSSNPLEIGGINIRRNISR